MEEAMVSSQISLYTVNSDAIQAGNLTIIFIIFKSDAWRVVLTITLLIS